MDKKELLREIARKELDRLENLPLEELRKEASNWFNIEVGGDRQELTDDLLNDFMRYREAESLEELKHLFEKGRQFVKTK